MFIINWRDCFWKLLGECSRCFVGRSKFLTEAGRGINRLSILAIFIMHVNGEWFLHSSVEFRHVFKKKLHFIIIAKTINKNPSQIMQSNIGG